MCFESLLGVLKVLKQNRGSTGEGIWLVRPYGWTREGGVQVTNDSLVAATEMVDNHEVSFFLPVGWCPRLLLLIYKGVGQ